MSEATALSAPHQTTGTATADGKLELDTPLPLRGRVRVSVMPLVETAEPEETSPLLRRIDQYRAAAVAAGWKQPTPEETEEHVRFVMQSREECEEAQLAREAMQDEHARLREDRS